MVRITVPNPLGPPVTLDTTNIRLPGVGGNPIILPYNLHRRPRLLVVPVLIILILLLGSGGNLRPPLPPSYSDEYTLEQYLPQVDTRLPAPEGRDGRYIKFDVPQGTGFNHQLSRVLLNHHLAVLSNRAMAFEPVVNDTPTGLGRLFSWPWRASKVPMTAFLHSISSGFEGLYNAPRAVPLSHYNRVCPSYKRKILTVHSDERPHGDLKLLSDGQERIHQLQVLLLGSDEQCISIVGDLFDESFFDSSAHLDLIDSFIESPVMKHFSFSPRVLSILNRHLPFIAPQAPLYSINEGQDKSTTVMKRPQWKHILALHLRKNDFDQVCAEKGHRLAPFVAFNKLPLLPGNENVPPPPEMVEATRLGLYRAKCAPQILEIIARARRMRVNHPLLTTVYILSDGDDAWLEETRNWIASEGWMDVFVGGRDFSEEWDEKDVSIAVDMEVARRAGVFVGNGFSTTTSNIVLLRTRDGVHPDLTQFW